jgi:hypothetical protein
MDFPWSLLSCLFPNFLLSFLFSFFTLLFPCCSTQKGHGFHFPTDSQELRFLPTFLLQCQPSTSTDMLLTPIPMRYDSTKELRYEGLSLLLVMSFFVPLYTASSTLKHLFLNVHVEGRIRLVQTHNSCLPSSTGMYAMSQCY